MRIIITYLVIAFTLLFGTVANAANIKEYPRIAVMQFGNKAITSEGLRTGDFTMCSEYAIYQLLASGWFDLIDYEQLTNIAKMHSINMSGVVDQSTAVELGRVASAQFMVVGNVTGLTLKESTLGIKAGNKGNIGGNKHTVNANVVMRIVDIETARIIAVGLGYGSSSSTSMEIEFTPYRKSNENTESGVGGDGEAGLEDDEETNNQLLEGLTNTANEALQKQLGDLTETDYLNNVSYKIKIGSESVSDVQVRNALGKAVRDAVYGKTGLMTTLNGGKPLKIKTRF